MALRYSDRCSVLAMNAATILNQNKNKINILPSGAIRLVESNLTRALRKYGGPSLLDHSPPLPAIVNKLRTDLGCMALLEGAACDVDIRSMYGTSQPQGHPSTVWQQVYGHYT